MNKKSTTELRELAKKFGRTLSKNKDKYDIDPYYWEKFGTPFFDWLGSQKHNFDMDKMLEWITEFYYKLELEEENQSRYDVYECCWGTYKDCWEDLGKKFILFCSDK